MPIASVVKCLPAVPSPRGEMDIISGFEPAVPSSNLGEGTGEAGGDITIIFSLMKKIIFAILLLLSVGYILFPQTSLASACYLVNNPDGSPKYPELSRIEGGQRIPLGLVPCGQYPDCRCEITDFFVMLLRLFNFITFVIATPLAGLIILIGGIMIMISGGPGSANPITGVISPNMYSTGKAMVFNAVIAVILIFTSWIIMNAVMAAFGFLGAWHTPFGP